MIKKISFVIFSLAFLTTTASAFEWGGKFDNQTRFEGNKSSDLSLKQKDSLCLWITSPLNKSSTAVFAAEGSYGFEFDKEADSFTNIADISLFKISYNHNVSTNGTLSLNAGRYSLADSTGLIFNQQSDGLLLGYSTPKASISGYAGYTGFLNKKNNSMISFESPESEKDFYDLAAKFVPYGLMFKFPSLFANQNVGLEAWGFADLNDNSIDRYYAVANIGGFIGKGVSYKLSTAFNTTDFSDLANLSIANIYIFPSTFAIVSTGVTYASGSNDSIDPFIGVTSIKSTLARSEPEYTDLFKLDLNAIFNILSTATASTGVATVFDSSIDYKGFQWQADINWYILRDLQLGASVSQFFGKDSEEDKTNVSLKASINF